MEEFRKKKAHKEKRHSGGDKKTKLQQSKGERYVDKEKNPQLY